MLRSVFSLIQNLARDMWERLMLWRPWTKWKKLWLLLKRVQEVIQMSLWSRVALSSSWMSFKTTSPLKFSVEVRRSCKQRWGAIQKSMPWCKLIQRCSWELTKLVRIQTSWWPCNKTLVSNNSSLNFWALVINLELKKSKTKKKKAVKMNVVTSVAKKLVDRVAKTKRKSQSQKSKKKSPRKKKYQLSSKKLTS